MAMAFDAERYTHDADRAALKALKAIPGFSALLKAFMNVWNERQQRILNMSSRIKISERQMRKYHDMLPPICEKLGIPVPDLYLEMNVTPNAYTSGDTNPFIVITSGLLKTLPEELVPTILAHECGHIACHHVLYQTMGRIVLQGAGNLLGGILPLRRLLTVPLQVAFYYWMRCSEFSADRVAVLCDGTDRKMQEVCMRLAGWDRDIDAEVSLEAFLEQAADYRDLIHESKWNKALEFMILSQASHPLLAVRATECRNWFTSESYRETVSNLVDTEKRLAPEPPRLAEPAGGVPAGAEVPEGTPPLSAQEAPRQGLVIPGDYTQLPSKPSDPAGSVVFGRVNTQSNSFIRIRPAAPHEALYLKSPEEIVAEAHRNLADDEGLVAVGSGSSSHGRKYAYVLLKASQQPRGTEYKLAMHFEGQDSPAAVNAYFSETGSPGFREATVKGQVKREFPEIADNPSLWNRDPYDPAFTGGLLMNESEKEKYDARFPLHPLTEARNFIRALIALN